MIYIPICVRVHIDRFQSVLLLTFLANTHRALYSDPVAADKVGQKEIGAYCFSVSWRSSFCLVASYITATTSSVRTTTLYLSLFLLLKFPGQISNEMKLWKLFGRPRLSACYYIVKAVRLYLCLAHCALITSKQRWGRDLDRNHLFFLCPCCR